MMPLFEIMMPGNAGIFFKAIMEIAAFDFYEFGEHIHDWLDIPPTEPVDYKFDAIGFESRYFLVNMGSMAIFYLIYIVLILVSLLFSCLLGILCCKCKCL